MLYDPKWEQKTETKADPTSLKDLIAWLETKPTDGPYNFMDCGGGCLYGLYFQEACGLPWWLAEDGSGADVYLARISKTPQEKIAQTEPHTFGAALERARAL